MAKVTIANLNTLLDTVVTSNIAVQTAQSAVTNATVQAGNATTSAQAAALSKSQIDQQVIVIDGLANDINADVLAATAIKDTILALEEAIRLDADQITLDKAAVDVKAGLIEELVEDFHTKYLGASLEAPNASWEGMELAPGMIYYDITKNSLMLYINANIWVPILEAVNVLIATSNLADLPDKAEARTNLDVMSTQEVADKIQEDILAVKGQPLGLAELDANGHVPANQLPSYVDDVIEVATYADLPVIGEKGKIYIVVADETSNGDTSSYRWTGTAYARVSNSLTAADVKSLYESNLDTNAYTDAEQVKVGYITVTQAVDLDTIESDTILNNSHRTSNGTDHTYIDQDVTTTATPTFAGIITDGLVDGRDVSVDGLKLDGIEVGATADQTATEIEALYEGLADTNKYTDAEKTSVGIGTALNTTATTLPTAINEVHGEVNAHLLDTSVHGVTTVVGTIETQTLTNKTIDNINNLIGADHIHYKVRNASGSTIAIDTVVTASGTQPGTDYIQVIPVTDPQTQIALGIAHTELLNNGIGLVMNTGVHNNANTSAWTVGTLLYPNTTGGLTSTKPTSGRYQACAVVLRQHSSSGTLLCEFTEPKLFGSTTQAGYVQLNDTLTSTSVTEALTAAQGKALDDTKAPLASPSLTGTPLAPTAAVGTNTTQIATTAFVNAEIANDAVLLTSDQTIAGTKTFSSPIKLSKSGFTATLQSGTLSGDVVHTLPSASSNLASEQYVLDNGFTVASTAEAKAGTDNTKGITPLRLREALNASGTAPIYACRAWVNFNGTGTVAIRASGNVSSVTDNGVGDYTVNFTTAMPDVNYSISNTSGINVAGNTATYSMKVELDSNKKTTSVRMLSNFASGTFALIDITNASIAIFR